MNQDVLANIGANIESKFYNLAEPPYSDGAKDFNIKFNVPGMNGTQEHSLHVVDVLDLQTNDVLMENGQAINVDGPKAIAFKDEAGNLYVHFNGTGDGKWGYNTQAYDGQASIVQQQSLDFFNETIQKYYEGSGTGKVFVSGHSQGGNTAQYVTINSSYGDYIDTCISLDGPGFSQGIIDQAINQYGEAHFNNQCDKIYAYNGQSDFVSPLGQVHIIPEGHTTVVGNAIFNNNHDIAMAHDVNGMLVKEDGCISLDLVDENGNPYHDSAFRDFIESFAAEVTTLSPEDQARAAELAMKFAEYFLGNGHTGANLQSVLTQQDLDDFTELLIPLLASYLEKNPDMLGAALQDLGFSPDVAALIDGFIKNFDDLPEDQRKAALEALFNCLIIKEDGSIGLNADLMSIIFALTALIPTLAETAAEDPTSVYTVLNEYGIIDMVTNFIEQHPFATFAITVLIGVFMEQILSLGIAAVVIMYAIEAFYTIVKKLSELAQEIKEFILQALQSIKETIAKIKEYLRKNSPGGKYVSSNPYFSADPTLLRDYARRLGSINSRLRDLDRDLNDLYWQVGFLDLWDILQANILTSYSVNVRLSQSYLNTAADTIEAADNTALQYMGG